MAFVIADRVRETTTTTGTGNLTLAGAVSKFRTFASVLSSSDTTYYSIVEQTGTAWEVGIGTFTSPSTLARTTILSSSNGGSAVDFAAGTKDVFISLPAGKTNTNDQPNVIAVNSTSNALRITQTGTGNALVVEDSANPDSSPFVVDASGFIIQGYTSNITGAGFQSNSGTPFSGISWNAAATGPTAIIGKSRSATIGTNSIVLNGDTVGNLQFSGDDGAAFIPAASISAAVDGTPGLNDMPGRLVFSTTADGASTPTERMRIDSSGNVGIGTTAPGSALDVKGTLRLSGATSGYVGLAPAAAAGSTTYTLPAADGTSGQVLSTNGSGTLSWASSGNLTRATAVTASGVSVDFTGIPSGVKRITVMFNGVSTSGTSVRQIQLGDSGGVEITGYTGSVATTNSAGAGNNAAFAGAGFALQNSGNTLAADTLYGNLVFTNVSGNIWVGTGILVASNQPATFYISGVKTLSDVLTQVRITTVNGTDTFDAGSINILYE